MGRPPLGLCRMVSDVTMMLSPGQHIGTGWGVLACLDRYYLIPCCMILLKGRTALSLSSLSVLGKGGVNVGTRGQH